MPECIAKQKTFRGGEADWQPLVATELSVGFKSEQGLLICHRQNEAVFDGFFIKISSLYPESAGLTAEQICDEVNIELRCLDIFDEVAPAIWRGPDVSWLIQSSNTQHGDDTSADCYWKTCSKGKRKL